MVPCGRFIPIRLSKSRRSKHALLSLPFLLAVHASGQSASAEQWRFAGRQLHAGERLTLPYAGPPGTVPSLSMRDTLAPDALQNPAVQAVKGKVVVLGASYAGMNDAHLTPYGRGFFETPLMIGAEIQAQVIEALMRGRFVDSAATPLRLAIAALIALAASLLWWRQRPTTGVTVLLAAVVISAAMGYLGTLRDFDMPTAHFQLTALLAFTGVYGWRFSHGEREQARLRNLFSRYVEPQVVDALIRSGDLPRLGGESRHMTVLFTDIRNFTTISEQLTPEEVVEMLNEYFGRACAALWRRAPASTSSSATPSWPNSGCP